MVKKYILISLVTKEKLIKEPYGRDILSLFYKQYTELFPQFGSFYEPINKPITTVETALEYWEGDPALYRRRSSVAGDWFISTDRNKVGWLNFQYNWKQQIDWFGIFQKLAVLSKSYFGYVHVFTDYEIEAAAIGSSIYAFTNGTASISLKKGIPQLGWGHYFGEEYVKELDIPLIKKHGFAIEPLGDGYVFHITDQLSDVITKYPYFDERRKLLKSLFRPGLFQNYAKYEHES